MIHHLALFDFHDGTPPHAIDELRTRLRELPSLIPQIASYDVVDDLGLRDTNSAMAVIAQFATSDDFASYVAHGAHQAVVSECISPIVSKRSSLQYER
jgi:hypothetical protein